MKLFLLLVLTIALGACATLPPPTHPDDLCHVFIERPAWYKAASAASARWQIPLPILMATMRQESAYQAKVRPPRHYYLGFIPAARASDAYGYAQAKKAIWHDYRGDAHHAFAARDDFADAVDFIGWYDDQSAHRDGIRKDDAYRLYLSYHEGWGGYQRRSWQHKPWLQHLARHVADEAGRYALQLDGCSDAIAASLHHWF